MGYTYPGTMTPLGGGRGWLDAAAAASILRIDRAIGHMLQITEAGRSFFQQEKHWLAYLRNGSPIALNPNTPSEHQKGKAIDSDEAQQFVALMEEHGWFRTVYRWMNGKWTLVERWHFEYFIERDKRRFDPAPATAGGTASPVPEEDEDMPKLIRWNELHVFALAQEAILYVDTMAEKGTLEALHARPVQDVDNAGLTAALNERGIHWDAVDAVMRKVGPGTGGRYWSRLMAEGLAIRGTQEEQSKTLADVLATAQAIPKAK